MKTTKEIIEDWETYTPNNDTYLNTKWYSEFELKTQQDKIFRHIECAVISPQEGHLLHESKEKINLHDTLMSNIKRYLNDCDGDKLE